MAIRPSYAGSQPQLVQLTEGWYFDTGQPLIGTTPGMIVDTNEHRTSLVITNTGTGTVFLGNSPQVSAVNGHALTAGGSIGLATHAAIWAVSATGSNQLTYLEEAT